MQGTNNVSGFVLPIIPFVARLAVMWTINSQSGSTNLGLTLHVWKVSLSLIFGTHR